MRRRDCFRDGLWVEGWVRDAGLGEEARGRAGHALAVLDDLGQVTRCAHLVEPGSGPIAPAEGALLCVTHPRSGLKCDGCAEAHRVRPRSGHDLCGCGGPAVVGPVIAPVLLLPTATGDYHHRVRLVGFDLCTACLTG